MKEYIMQETEEQITFGNVWRKYEPLCELIRCKDCKYSKWWYGNKYLCFLWQEDGINVFSDGFCNYGRRKEND